MQKTYKKAQKKVYVKRGKKKVIYTVNLTARSKAVLTLDDELNKQKTKNHPIPRGCNAKGKATSWRRGGDFPANRRRPGHNWKYGKDYFDTDSKKIMHYGKCISIKQGGIEIN